MKKSLYATVAVIYTLLSLIIVFSGLFVLNALPASVQSTLDGIFGEVSLPVSNSDVMSELNSQHLNIVDSDTSFLPEQMHGIYLDVNVDFSSTGASTAAEINAEIDEKLNYYKNFFGDTLYIKPDTENEFSGVRNADGSAYDMLEVLISRALQENYYIVLSADDSIVFNNKGRIDFDSVKHYLSSYKFDAVILSSESLYSNSGYLEAAKYYSLNIASSFPAVYFGVEARSSSASAYADEYVSEVLKNGYADFVLVDAGGAINSSSLPFTSVINWWNSLAGQYPQIKFYCKERCDKVCSNSSDWSDYTEIVKQQRILWDCDNFSGSLFYSSTALMKNLSTSSQRLSYFLYDGEQDDLAVKRISLDSDNNTVTFYGSYAGAHKLYCNSEVCSVSGGAFNLTFSLTAGTNEFEFENAGKSITYRVYNNSKIIYGFLPECDMNVAKDEILQVYAICMDNASVYALLDGKSLEMFKDPSLSADNIPEGYSVFTCGISFNNSSYSDLNLGKLNITAYLGNDSETVTCGRVTLLKSNTSPLLNSILQFVYSVFFNDAKGAAEENEQPEKTYSGVTPFDDNGLGKALMCRIYYDNTEQLGEPGEYDTYHPTYSSLPEGTYDYIDSMTVSEEGYIRYELHSGISVYGVNCELINNAYKMPDNRAIVNKVDDTKPSSTDIVFDLDWLSPVTVSCLPQSYHSGYLNYSFNVSEFSAEYVDVTFNYTTDFFNSALLSFSESSPVSSFEILKSGDNTLILRLFLRHRGMFFGYDLYTNDNGQLVLSLKKRNDNSVAGKVIMLDAGHGGLAMTGTALNDNSVAEETVTLAIAKKAKELLEAKGATVLMTRTAPTPLTLSERSEIAYDKNPDIFISIHCDGSENLNDSGTHTFYYRSYSQPLAKAINASLSYNYATYIYSPTDTNYSSVNRGIKYYPFFVTRIMQCPSVLVETGFMTNEIEGRILTDNNCQYWIADGIANGIVNYFAENY